MDTSKIVLGTKSDLHYRPSTGFYIKVPNKKSGLSSQHKKASILEADMGVIQTGFRLIPDQHKQIQPS